MWEGLGLVSDWKSNVSVSVLHHKVSFTSRPIYIFILFFLTLKRVEFYQVNRFKGLSIIFHTIEGMISTFYLFNWIRFTSIWSITSITSSFFIKQKWLRHSLMMKMTKKTIQWLYDLVTLIIKLMKQQRWRQQTAKHARHWLKKNRELPQLSSDICQSAHTTIYGESKYK